MSLSAIIVDDEQLARDELAYLLKELDVDVVAQGKNGMDAVNMIKEYLARPRLPRRANAGTGRLWRN